MENTIDKSFVVPYRPTEEEFEKGERKKILPIFCWDWLFLADEFENQLEFPWTSYHAYLEYSYKQSSIFPPIHKLISSLKNADFSDYNSLAKISLFIKGYNDAPPIPLGTYKSQAYGISFYADIVETAEFESEDDMDEVDVDKDYRAEWLMRLDILHSVDNPELVFSAPTIPFGTLVSMDDHTSEPDMLFRLVINAIDSSLWLVFEFSRYTDVGCDKYTIGKGDEWGKLAPDDVPFTAARIAESVADSGIGKADWEIPSHSRIRGGPGTVTTSVVDDDFLQKTIPAPSSAYTPSQPPKKLNVGPCARVRHDWLCSEAPGLILTKQ